MIALTIDEDGMALTADKKVAIAKRIQQLATEKYGLRGIDLIFDALTLPISTGQEDYRSVLSLAGGEAHPAGTARGKDNSRRQQCSFWTRCLSQACAEFGFYA